MVPFTLLSLIGVQSTLGKAGRERQQGLSATKRDLRSESSMEHLSEYVEGPLLDNLYWDTWYNNISLPQDENLIFYENALLGVPRIRQLKVRNNSCVVHGYFENSILDCYGAYSHENEDVSTFGPGNHAAWKYQQPKLYDWYWGELGYYGSGGYVVNLTRTKPGSAKLLADLKHNSWLDVGTRAVFIEFSVYNANVNLFCIVRLLIEFPATGGALTSWDFCSVKFLRYVSAIDYFIASCEIIFCLFMFAFLIQSCVGLCKMKNMISYYKNVWNCIDLVMIAIAFVAIGFHVYCTVEVPKLMVDLSHNQTTYTDFQFLAYWQVQYNNMIAFNIFLAWIKVLKFINFNKTMTQLTTTLFRSTKELIGFAVIFCIVFLSYAQFAYLSFGAELESFHTFQNCM
ncbi:polycystic kidney disease 2-like 2 protein [Protopterus annectens]|uniref:polycystic kidney disease 2-like 2 protein n=1 Tax=Protopterus annectens TaxID=7888 RepID=UPI001CFACCDB|nr:polycystic kidney disease 2-like 2 protein [Protopterus annectens]